MGQPFPGLMNFDHHPWAREMHDCDAEFMVGQKGAQLGYTEVALNKTFYNIDILGNSVLYVLPAATPGASNFSTSRFDPALELSPHLQNLFSDVKNIGHKRAGSANLFIRGSRSRSQLKSIPVSTVIVDEIDEMVQENIALIWERMSGQLQKQAFLLSTPTIEHYGINLYYRQSTEEHFFFNCPHCSRLIELKFPDSLEICGEHWSDPKIKDTFLKCHQCNHKLEHAAKKEFLKTGRWVATHTDRDVRGFHVSQLYSSTVKPADLAVSYLRGLSNPSDEQEFFNSKLGLPHEPEGSRITETDIVECTGGHKMKEAMPHNAFVTMGVDVGKWLHVWIDQWFFDRGMLGSDINLQATARTVKVLKLQHFEELDALMRQYGVNFCVVDANPERRKATEFAQRFHGYVRLCFYGRGITSKEINISPTEPTLTVHRTSWLDLSLGRFRRRQIQLPVDLPTEAKDNLKALVRIFQKDQDGNAVAKYVKADNDADHYAHARNYSEMALQMGASMAVSGNISGGIF
jgi:hypothetical protein